MKFIESEVSKILTFGASLIFFGANSFFLKKYCCVKFELLKSEKIKIKLHSCEELFFCFKLLITVIRKIKIRKKKKKIIVNVKSI